MTMPVEPCRLIQPTNILCHRNGHGVMMNVLTAGGLPSLVRLITGYISLLNIRNIEIQAGGNSGQVSAAIQETVNLRRRLGSICDVIC
jgi:hypothetical protein